jgi:hypothetical protein
MMDVIVSGIVQIIAGVIVGIILIEVNDWLRHHTNKQHQENNTTNDNRLLEERQKIIDILIEPIVANYRDRAAVEKIIAAGRAKNVNLLGNLLVVWEEYESETNEKLKAKRFEVFIADVKEARNAYNSGKNQTFGIHENEVASPKWVRRLSTAALMFVALGAVFQCLRMTLITWFFIILTGLTILPCVWFLTPFVIEKAKRKRKDNADKKKQNT